MIKPKYDVKVFFTKQGQEFTGIIVEKTKDDNYLIEKMLAPMVSPSAMGGQKVSVQLVPISLTTPDVTMSFHADEIRTIVDAPEQILKHYEKMFEGESSVILPTDSEVATSYITKIK